jgi:hypothetical protein
MPLASPDPRHSRDPELSRLLERLLDPLADLVLRRFPELESGTLVLGGSAALGEAAGVVWEDGRWRLLSDLDLVALVGTKRDESLRHRTPELRREARELAAGLGIDLEGSLSLGFYTPAELQRLPRRPETADLGAGGIVLRGDEDALNPLGGRVASPEPFEGIRLLRNRAVEHLGGHPERAGDGLAVTYAVAKAHADAWTAWTCVTGEYVSGASARLRRLETDRGFPWREKTAAWMRWRLEPDRKSVPREPETLLESWRRAGRVLLECLEAISRRIPGGADAWPALEPRPRGLLPGARVWRATYRYRGWGGGLGFLREGMRLASGIPMDYCHALAGRILAGLAGGLEWSDPPAGEEELRRLAPRAFAIPPPGSPAGLWIEEVLGQWSALA